MAIVADTIYGLNNVVGPKDPERALKVAAKLKFGPVIFEWRRG